MSGAEEVSSGLRGEDVGASWWSFRPVSQPAVPVVPVVPGGRIGNPVDAFLASRLASQGLAFNPEASPRVLLRRLYFDVVGLPPTPEEVAEFERDPSPAAWMRRVEALLARPEYGERWGRHWLDVVRFAQSNGYERDGEKLQAWRYRDYVIHAFNQDKPYDQFVREQIAGDELAPAFLDPEGKPGEAWREAMVATGFLRLGVHDDEPDDPLQAEFDELDDMVSTSGAAFLGMTLGCARCHDHKFDPIPQQDYYSLLAVFRPLKSGGGKEHGLDSPLFAPLAGPTQIAAWKAAQERQREALELQRKDTTNEATRKAVSEKIAELQKSIPPFEWALAARERTDAVPAVHVLSRGNPRSPGSEVRPGFLRAAGGGEAVVKEDGARGTSGRRLALAHWIASPDNPLTARVMVNRVWHHHFGRGLVRTTTDFGRVGSQPTHPELLDWLAGEFIRSGWSVKSLHRLILTSAAWKQSSSATNAAALTADPGNDLLWRQNLRRLDAEALRDSVLSISGRLNPAAGGRGFFPALSGEVLAGGSRPGTDWQVSSPEERARRSVYTYIRRTSMVPLLEAFDYSNATSPLSERPITTVAPQALMLLNDEFVQEQAAALAERVVREVPSGSVDERIVRAWSLATARNPGSEEVRQVGAFWKRQAALWSGLEHRISFRPDVPDTLSVPYFQSLPASRFLGVPGPDWESHKGYWPREYEGNKALEPGRGPFALWKGAMVSEGEFETEVVPQIGCSQVGILWCATASEGGAESGYEVVLEPREGRAALRCLSPTNVVELAACSGWTLQGDRLPVRVALHDGRIAVFLHGDSQPVMQIHTVPGGPVTGHLGVRAWGSGVSLDRPHWNSGQGTVPLWPARSREWAGRKALESACLLVLNLNEVAYVD